MIYTLIATFASRTKRTVINLTIIVWRTLLSSLDKEGFLLGFKVFFVVANWSRNNLRLALIWVTYPYDVLRLRLAVEPGCRTMSKVAGNLLSREGLLGFCSGLGPSLLGIAPYIAVNFYFFDLVKKSLPKEYQNRTESYLATALVSASLATLVCYPLDTVKRQMQMRGSSYKTVYDMVNSCGIIALYRGFIPNALKNLTNSSIRFMTFDTVRSLITASQEERERIMKENLDKWKLQRERRHHEK
ncbi:hypothetical protein GIB67_034109 [Kingdonia uniflora]|uniref:Mitochondrial carrier protein n=1 Tax=Kingdonia uniflora TaxID=39325 RepID=A0A7J7M6H8_9MAGN|nr:hypothetical protein GIB67_034109 [Kingdonia uniflora]